MSTYQIPIKGVSFLEKLIRVTRMRNVSPNHHDDLEIMLSRLEEVLPSASLHPGILKRVTYINIDCRLLNSISHLAKLYHNLPAGSIDE